MGSYRDKVIEDIIDVELFHSYTIGKDGEKIPTYVSEGFDKEKIEAEGSIWIVYVYDCMREYYQRNKRRIDKEARRILMAEAGR